MTGELFKSLTATPDILQVPYRGAGPGIADLISGHIPMGFFGFTGQVLQLHRSGKLRILAVTTPARPVAAPEIPTTAEAGLPGLTTQAALGLLAPAGTPKAIIERTAEATVTAVAERTYQRMLIESGFEPTLNSNPEKFRRSLEADIAFWRPVVEALGLKID